MGIDPAVCENLVDRVTVVEKDEGVAAVWHVILNGGAEWLGDAIIGF
jgi:DNA adenine methylase